LPGFEVATTTRLSEFVTTPSVPRAPGQAR
jgi:hypothetical protein